MFFDWEMSRTGTAYEYIVQKNLLILLVGATLVGEISPHKSSIDTKNGYIQKEPPFPNHHFGALHVSFLGCIRSFYLGRLIETYSP